MNLFLATFLTGILCLIFAFAFISPQGRTERLLKSFPRSRAATLIFFGGSGIWFLWEIAHLSETDFGEHKTILFLLFSAIILSSFFYVRDFLAVRGLAILILLYSKLALNAAYFEDSEARLFLVTFIYMSILVALYLSAVPFKVRDFLNWIFEKKARHQCLGGIFSIYGLLLLCLAWTFKGFN